MSESVFTYHVISNEIGTVLAVYGEALLNEAQGKARSIGDASGCKTYLHHIKVSSYKDKPRVGQTISMKGMAL